MGPPLLFFSRMACDGRTNFAPWCLRADWANPVFAAASVFLRVLYSGFSVSRTTPLSRKRFQRISAVIAERISAGMMKVAL